MYFEMDFGHLGIFLEFELNEHLGNTSSASSKFMQAVLSAIS